MLTVGGGGVEGEVAAVGGGGRLSAVSFGLYRYSFDPFLLFPAKL